MKVYRTDEQWEHMCENALNGNWSDAAQDAVDFGFYANDMLNKWESEEFHIVELSSLVYLAEYAQKKRGE